MDRTNFLTQAWDPYPSAKTDWGDVASFLKSGSDEQIVGGRLTQTAGGTWALTSAGEVISIAFSPRLSWLREQRSAVKASATLFSEGDLVAVRLKRPAAYDASVKYVFECDGVLLLAPSRGKPSRLARSVFNVERSRLWADYLYEVRAYFNQSGFTEALTPTLVPPPGTEPFLDPFKTDWEFGSHVQTFYLPTSPEFHLKKMLASGWTRVFEFKPCFRNGEISEHHQPEFLMLEWYRAYSNLDAIADDVEALLKKLSSRFQEHLGDDNPIPPLKRTTMARLFADEFPGFVLRPETSREELVTLAENAGISVARSDSWDDVFFRIFLERIESKLGFDGPLLVRGYPPSQAALSRIGPDGFADRFEVYWRGLELANAFHELNDPNENETRFRDDARKKRELGKPAVPVDEELIESLRWGLPPSGGIALGVDRLFMALFEIDSISDARAFPIIQP